MARTTKEERLRMEGAAWAYRVAQTRGIKGLGAELESRKASGMPLGVSNSDRERMKDRIWKQSTECMTMLSMSVLHDEFGFGQRRLERFMERYLLKSECINNDYVTWRDIADSLKDECGIEFTIHGVTDKEEEKNE